MKVTDFIVRNTDRPRRRVAGAGRWARDTGGWMSSRCKGMEACLCDN